ncbi:MAG: class II glutamine amidotransferase [Proteobacteria bacterium]|nr:class II glutamine amidotransferase [Pseudomonadota bacterium]
MCQLLGMNCNKPSSLEFSLEGFVRRGGQTDEHRDGWGFAWFDDEDCRVLRDDRPSCSSPLAEQLRRAPVKSRNLIVHIRKATQGAVDLSNCHPFSRTLWGRNWVFAHNGDLKNHTLALDGSYTPAGTTDSEHAFCYLMQELRQRCGPARPAPAALLATLAELCEEIAFFGPFNFLLSDGSGLFAHCSTQLHHVRRAYPFRSVRLVDHDLSVDFARRNQVDDCMTVIATKPLTTGEEWVAFAPGELKYFCDGTEAQPHAAPAKLAVTA